jgi:hypothetical protein
MASLLVAGICPSCGAKALREHCDHGHRTCDWARCTRCNSFGTRDGRRWVDARKKESA